jgi:Kef-type K+ transport system membrane component KefB
MVLLLLSVWATEALAIHALFGAFLMGVVVPKNERLEQELRDRLEPVTRVLLLPHSSPTPACVRASGC